jgi:hypothetical protein
VPKKLWALCAVAACLLGAALPGTATGRAADCRPLTAIFYASTNWLQLADALHANMSPCAQYYVSVPPTNTDKTALRSGQASQIRALGPSFHALAEINVTAWSSWVAGNGGSWYAAGQEARRRMAAAGFDVTLGDTWAVNELPSAVRTGTGTARQDMRDLVHGLYDGDGSTPPTKGVVFAEGIGQSTSSLATYKANLEAWLQDTGFWTDMSSYVADFLQETYGDAREYGVAGADVPTRLTYLNQFLEHELTLASVAPSTAAAGQAELSTAFAPLANAAWPWTTAYGYTQIPYDQMQDYVTAQVQATRSFDASLGWSGDRIGFAWAPNQAGSGLSSSDFSTQSNAILSQLATAIVQSSDPTSGGACQGTWCTAAVDGAAFTNAWSAFSSWTPTVPVFTSAPQTVAAGAASAPLTVQLQTGGVAPVLPYPVDVVFGSSSPTGGFSTSAAGPWTPTLDVTLPAGTSTATVYTEDPAAGTPTLTATALGAPATQLETVAAPAPGGSGGAVPAPAVPPVSPTPLAAATTAAPVVVTPPPLPAMHFARARFARRAGRLVVTLRLLTAAGAPIPQATVSFSVRRGAQTFASSAGRTSSAGSVGVVPAKLPVKGCYAVHVKSIRVADYTWNRVSPTGRYCVTSTLTVPSSTRTGKVRTGK